MNYIKYIFFMVCATLGFSQTTPIRNPQIQGASGSIISGATLANNGTFNGNGAFNFSSGTVTLPSTVSGLASWAGVNSITTLGTITTGTWNATPIGVAYGGSGQSSLAASIQAYLDAISTTQGTILYNNGTDWVALAPGTSGHFLKTQGAAANPVWAAASGGGGSGTVTSVAVSGSDGIEIDSGSPITGAGTIALGVNASTMRTHLGLVIGTNVQAWGTKLDTISALANSAGVMTNDGSGTFSYTGTSTGGNGSSDSGKLVKFDGTGGVLVTSLLRVRTDGASYPYTYIDDLGFGYRNGVSSIQEVVFATVAPGTKTLTIPNANGTFAVISSGVLTVGETGTTTGVLTLNASGVASGSLSIQPSTDGNGIHMGESAGALAHAADLINIGFFAGGNTATPGSWGVNIGRHAGYEATGGNFVNIGHAAGQLAYSSGSAVNIGYLAGRNSTANGAHSGDDSVLIGHEAGQATVTSAGSVMLGAYAGGATTTAGNSVLVGHQAGYAATTSTQCVYVGPYAGRNLSRAQTLVIEGDLTLAAAGTGAMFYGEFDNRLLSLGVSTLKIGGAAASAEVRLLEPSGSGTNYTGFKAPALAGNVMYTLPTADGTSGQALTTNASGVLSFASFAGLGANTFTGQQINSTNGAASTSPTIFNGRLYTGGTGTTTHALVTLFASSLAGVAPTAATTLSTAGTVLHINTPSGFTGNMIDGRLDGSDSFKFRVDYLGNVYIRDGHAFVSAGSGSFTIKNAGSDSIVSGSSGVQLVGGLTLGGSPGAANTFIYSESAAVVQLGLDVNGAAVNQTIKAHDGITGTDRSGANLTLASGNSTGTGTSVVIISTPAAGSTGTTARTAAERIRISSAGLTIGSGTAVAKLKHGTATLTAGTVTVSDSDVVAGSRIFVNRQTDGGTLGDSYSVAITAATNFVIQSKTANANVAGDTSTVSWLMVNP